MQAERKSVDLLTSFRATIFHRGDLCLKLSQPDHSSLFRRILQPGWAPLTALCDCRADNSSLILGM